jgi:hypothetical protein
MSLDPFFDATALWEYLTLLQRQILRMFYDEPGVARSSSGSLQKLADPNGATGDDVKTAVDALRALGYLKVAEWHGMFYAFETPRGMLLTWKAIDSESFGAAIKRLRDALPHHQRFASVKTVADTAKTPLYFALAMVDHWQSQGLLRFDNSGNASSFARIDSVRGELFSLKLSNTTAHTPELVDDRVLSSPAVCAPSA